LKKRRIRQFTLELAKLEAVDERKAHLTATAVAAIPKQFLHDVIRRAEIAYAATYDEVKHHPQTLIEHKLAKLKQVRCFRMEYEMAEAAKACGLPHTSKLLPENDWCYTYVVTGNFGLTQAYVQQIGSLPNSAKYRENLANASRIPRLALDEDPEIYKARKFYGLIAHNPVGQLFDESKQKMGSIQLCIPCEGMKGWALEIPLVELLSYYPVEIRRAVATPEPMWKKAEDKKVSGET
jgi:hypothetical protein